GSANIESSKHPSAGVASRLATQSMVDSAACEQGRPPISSVAVLQLCPELVGVDAVVVRVVRGVFDGGDQAFQQRNGAAVADVDLRAVLFAAAFGAERSEEHTSELQSRENLVCRLLLEKKK